MLQCPAAVTDATSNHDVFFGQEITRAKADNPLLQQAPSERVALDSGRLHIVVERASGRPASSVEVYEGDLCRIGSHASNDIVVADPTISRFHCRIVRERTGWRIVDSGSTNGTRVDGVKIVSAELEREVLLSLGDSVLRVTPDGVGEVVDVPVVRALGGLVGTSLAMQRLFNVLERIAPSDIDVLVHGESGTGKELVATELVQRSPRANGPLVVVDCGAISPSLVESELFGHVRGAFTGADREREGAFEAADGGTVFLDEIGELPLELQPKLLRALEAREVRRVGQTKPKRVDVRVVAATHRDLEREVNKGRFREDLYYRLAKVSVRVPPLRDRLDDVPFLTRTFLGAIRGVNEGAFERLFPPAVLAEMQGYDWPGNVRELRNYVERRTVLEDVELPARRDSGVMRAVDPSDAEVESRIIDRSLPFRVAKEQAVAAFERAYIEPLLVECQGNVSKAARAARMDRMYLHQLAQKYGIRTSPRK